MNYTWEIKPLKRRERDVRLALNQKKQFKELDKSSLDEIAGAVSTVFGVSIEMIKEKRRLRHINVIPKQVICFLAREKNITHWFIALYLGYTDHSTSIHGVKTVRDLLTYDKDFQSKIAQVRAIIDFKKEQAETINDLKKFDN